MIYISMQPLSTIEDGEEKEKEKAIDEILALLPVIVNLENNVAKIVDLVEQDMCMHRRYRRAYTRIRCSAQFGRIGM
jgi:hypothetical protein